jgi:hypothetical protein
MPMSGYPPQAAPAMGAMPPPFASGGGGMPPPQPAAFGQHNIAAQISSISQQRVAGQQQFGGPQGVRPLLDCLSLWRLDCFLECTLTSHLRHTKHTHTHHA